MLSWAGMESSQRVLSRVPLTCDPTGCSLPGSSVRGILQARTLEWGILSQASNLHLLHWQAVLYHHVPWDTPDSRILLPLPQLSRRRACAHASQVEARFLAALLMASLVSKPPKGLVFLVSDSKAGTHSVVHTLSPEDGTQPLYPPFPVSLRSLLLPKSMWVPLPARLVCFQWALPLASLWLSAHGGM